MSCTPAPRAAPPGSPRAAPSGSPRTPCTADRGRARPAGAGLQGALATQLVVQRLSGRRPPPPPPPAAARSSVMLPERRDSTVAWLVELASWYAHHPQTLHYAVSYFDRFLQRCAAKGRGVPSRNIQLVACGSFFVACKMLETEVPLAENLAELTAGACTRENITLIELIILHEFEWRLDVETPHDILPFLRDFITNSVEIGWGPATGAESHSRQVSQNQSDRESTVEPSTPTPTGPPAPSLFADEALESDDDSLRTTSQRPTSQSPTSPTSHKCTEFFATYSTAFADLALFSTKIMTSFSIGEVAAASVLLAAHSAAHRVDEYSVGKPSKFSRGLDQLWQTLFAHAGLRRSAVFHVCILLLAAWEHLLFVKVSVPIFKRSHAEKLDVGDVLRLTREKFASVLGFHCDQSLEFRHRAVNLIAKFDNEEKERIDGHDSPHWSDSCTQRTHRDIALLDEHPVLADDPPTLWDLTKGMPSLIAFNLLDQRPKLRRELFSTSPLSCPSDEENHPDSDRAFSPKPRRTSLRLARKKKIGQLRSVSSPPRKRINLGSITNLR